MEVGSFILGFIVGMVALAEVGIWYAIDRFNKWRKRVRKVLEMFEEAEES